MKLPTLLLVLATVLPAAAGANDFPTTDRVEYVMECMKNNQGKHEYLYKCSCAIDRIAMSLRYEDYVEVSTALRYQTLAGPRGAEFRDPEPVKEMARKYKAIVAEADQACMIKLAGPAK